MCLRGEFQDTLRVRAGSDWVGDSLPARCCSGCSIQHNVALSSAEAELNSAVRGIVVVHV